MKKLLLIFTIIGLIFLSACNITPENVDEVANAIQKKYDNIDSYQTTLATTSGSNSKGVLRQVERPDIFKDLLIKNGETVRVELCNKDTQIIYDTSTSKVTASKIINYNCEEKVSEYFNVFDKIKNIFDYNYVIEEIELDGKEVVHLTLSSKDSTHDYWTEQFWFEKSDYQLIKHSYKVMESDIVTNFNDLELNINIPAEDFVFEFPEGVEVSTNDASGGTNVPISNIPPESGTNTPISDVPPER